MCQQEHKYSNPACWAGGMCCACVGLHFQNSGFCPGPFGLDTFLLYRWGLRKKWDLALEFPLGHLVLCFPLVSPGSSVLTETNAELQWSMTLLGSQSSSNFWVGNSYFLALAL